jgi:hypothetical protein
VAAGEAGGVVGEAVLVLLVVMEKVMEQVGLVVAVLLLSDILHFINQQKQQDLQHIM